MPGFSHELEFRFSCLHSKHSYSESSPTPHITFLFFLFKWATLTAIIGISLLCCSWSLELGGLDSYGRPAGCCGLRGSGPFLHLIPLVRRTRVQVAMVSLDLDWHPMITTSVICICNLYCCALLFVGSEGHLLSLHVPFYSANFLEP